MLAQRGSLTAKSMEAPVIGTKELNIVLNWFEKLKERVPVLWFWSSSPEKSSSRTLRISTVRK